jgi:transcription elongation GreA/GreB family factor
MRIAKLEEVHANARLIDESQLDVSKVLVLSNVKIKNQANGAEMKYTLVGKRSRPKNRKNLRDLANRQRTAGQIGW